MCRSRANAILARPRTQMPATPASRNAILVQPRIRAILARPRTRVILARPRTRVILARRKRAAILVSLNSSRKRGSKIKILTAAQHVWAAVVSCLVECPDAGLERYPIRSRLPATSGARSAAGSSKILFLGKQSRAVVPTPTWLESSNLPPCNSTIDFVIEMPSPVPP